MLVECQKEVVSLVQNVDGVYQTKGYGEYPPEIGKYCPLLNLPLIFDTTLENIPAEVPYIFADPTLVNIWREKTKQFDSLFKVGLVWAGRPEHARDHFRSCSLDMFAPLINEKFVFFSLQKGIAAEQVKNLPNGMNLVDFTEDINDFSDTAAFVENLDLVISVDTAIAHLAGAMGKPIWTLIPFLPDWRWMLNREDTPWYPTMRLFRQQSQGDWESVIKKINDELQKEISKIHT